MKLSEDCPCCSKKPYETCCKPFHEGKLPESALQLMRSRYAAYALNKPDYIIKTTHPKNPHQTKDLISWALSISQFSKNTLFQKLEILNFKENGSTATVTFIAHLMQNNKNATFKEKSYFEKIGDQWLYQSGKIYS